MLDIGKNPMLCILSSREAANVFCIIFVYLESDECRWIHFAVTTIPFEHLEMCELPLIFKVKLTQGFVSPQGNVQELLATSEGPVQDGDLASSALVSAE